MSGLRSRNKGKRGEREACEAIAEAIPGLERQFAQSRCGADAPDIDGPNNPYWIEVKAQRSPNPASAWEQAKECVDDADVDRIPMALTKGDRRPWLVTITAKEFVRLYRLAVRWTT